MARPKSSNPRQSVANVRLTDAEHAEVEQAAASMGFKSISEYLRHLHDLHVSTTAHKNDMPGDTKEVKNPYKANKLRSIHSTDLGHIYQGNSLDFLHAKAKPNSVDLIVTSPPFGLVRKKSYGNEDAEDYCNWFRPFAEGFRRVLKENGSLVIDIGGAWKPGTPTRSLYHFDLLLMLCKKYHFHLCQEHFWWNPSKLPSPAEWVNIRRIRVKDAVNCIWWLSPSPWPKASNRGVLAPYSNSMRDLLKNGYSAKLRPSGHDISDKFQKDNGGSVPPNLLAIANTESNGRYQDYCRENDLEIHPARFPAQLPEYFIRMLTNPGDLVVDPFGGSCVTGMVAENLNRKWACIEMSESYVKGAVGRFGGTGKAPPTDKPTQYSISAPCAMPIKADAERLSDDGGQKRNLAPKVKITPAQKIDKTKSRHVNNTNDQDTAS